MFLMNWYWEEVGGGLTSKDPHNFGMLQELRKQFATFISLQTLAENEPSKVHFVYVIF